jgi:hypothetical protein
MRAFAGGGAKVALKKTLAAAGAGTRSRCPNQFIAASRILQRLTPSIRAVDY